MTREEKRQATDGLRILFVAGSSFGVDGLATMAYNWAMALDDAGVEVDIYSNRPFTGSRYDEELLAKGSRLLSAGIPFGQSVGLLGSYRALENVLKKHSYPIVHIHRASAYRALSYAICAKANGAERVIVHSHAASMEQQGLPKRVVNSVCRALLPLFATDHLACSQLAADWMFPRSALGEVRIIENDVDARRFAFDDGRRHASREHLGLPEGAKVIGFVGRLAPQKNPEGLLRILAAVHRDEPEARFLVVGDGDLADSFGAGLREECLEGVTTWIRHSGCPEDCYLAMDVLCLPSLFEGNPLVVAEAQASGLPCVVSGTVTRECDPLSQVTFLPIDDLRSSGGVCPLRSSRQPGAAMSARRGHAHGRRTRHRTPVRSARCWTSILAATGGGPIDEREAGIRSDRCVLHAVPMGLLRHTARVV